MEKGKRIKNDPVADVDDRQWITVILHGDEWHDQREYVVPWPAEYPAFASYEVLYYEDGMNCNTNKATDAPEKKFMKKLFKGECGVDEDAYDVLDKNVKTLGGFKVVTTTSENRPERYPRAIHAVLHTGYEAKY